MAKSKRKKLHPIHAVGRYAIGEEIAAGGMASIHLGRLLGPVGFSRTVAIKRLHPQLAKDPEFTAMFLDEARVSARVQHPNVVQTLDVVAQGGELFLVMEYVVGESFSNLLRMTHKKGERVPIRIAVTVIADALQGLHAAHQATNEHGEPLHIVHRDVSPQNVLVGTDGISRVIDFGIAKAIGRLQTTRDGQVKGKLAFMAPEQVRGGVVTRQTDVFAAASVLWFALTGRMLFAAENEGELLFQVLEGPIEPPSKHAPGIPPALDEVLIKGLERNPAQRFATARDMAVALERALGSVSPRQVASWVEGVAGDRLAHRARQLSEVEILSTIPGAMDTTTDATSTAPAPAVAADETAIDPPPPPSPPAPEIPEAPRGSRGKIAFAFLAVIALTIGGAFGAMWGMRRTAAAPAAPGAPTEAPPVVLAAPPSTPTSPSVAEAVIGEPGAPPVPSAESSSGRAPPRPSPAVTGPRRPGARPRSSNSSLFVRE